MNYQIEIIAEHSLIKSLLSTRGFIMDVGCRGFQFRDAMKAMGHKVYAIDCDKLDDPLNEYYRFALSDHTGFEFIHRSDDPQATKVKKVGTDEKIECMTIESFSKIRGPLHAIWDLIKLDIEGSEYEVIMSLTKAPAKQLSIEFHLHTGVYGSYEMVMMEDKLKALGYEFVQHDYTEQYGAGFNYWNSLFVLK